MKIICLILSFYVVLLTLTPCCADNDCKDSGTRKEQTGNQAREKECPGCSPFFACGSCVGFIVPQALTADLHIVAASHAGHVDMYQQPHIKKIVLSIWLPPKIG